MTEVVIEKPVDLVLAVLCSGHTIVAMPEGVGQNAQEYVRMTRAAIMGVDARPLIPDDSTPEDELPEHPTHVVSVTWYHQSLHVNSGHFACRHNPNQ